MTAARAAIWSTLAVALAAGAALFWTHVELTSPYYAARSTEVFVEITGGAGAHTVASLLADAGVVKNRLLFQAYVRWTGIDRHLKAGEYRFDAPATPLEVARRIVDGDIYYHSVTIPEGLTLQETVSVIEQSRLGSREDLDRGVQRVDWIKDLDPQARSLEGYVFPDTYRFPRGASADQIIRAAVRRFKNRYSALLSAYPLPQGWTARQIVTLASMIEKETGASPERPVVASVLVNRLERRIPLACDPTIIYALKLAGSFDGNLRKKDLTLDSPYNTYIHAGLPPGPICSPGEESLRAALSPQKTDYLYFVSRNDGTHEFSRDFSSHARAVERYQKNPARPANRLP